MNYKMKPFNNVSGAQNAIDNALIKHESVILPTRYGKFIFVYVDKGLLVFKGSSGKYTTESSADPFVERFFSDETIHLIPNIN